MRNTLLKNISQKLLTNKDIIVLLGDLGTFQMREASSVHPDRVIRILNEYNYNIVSDEYWDDKKKDFFQLM